MQKYFFFFLALFTVVLGSYYFFAYSNLSGTAFIYPIDDAYIHLALARNFAENGFWGVNPNSFDSASSSILYTLILSGLIKLFGDNVYYPLLINIAAGYATVYYCYRYFSDFYGKKELLIGMLLLIPYCQLYTMVILGMEQTLHILLTVMLIYYAQKNLRSDFANSDLWKLLLVVLLFGSVRFESMFFVLIFSALLCVNGKWKIGTAVFVTGFCPVIIFGLTSLACGGYFFPNSLLMKGNYPEADIFSSIWNIFKNGILTNVSFYKLFLAPMLMVAIYLFWKYKRQDWKKVLQNEILLMSVIGTVVLHSLFAVIRYRYENYLMAATLLVITPIVAVFFTSDKSRRFVFFKNLMLISFSGVLFYSVYIFIFTHKVIRYSSKNIEEQQIEMARFLSKFYPGQKIVANDIGAISYFSGVEIFDIAGLATTDVAGFYSKNKHLGAEILDQRSHQYMQGRIAQEHTRIAIIYPSWFPGGVPSTWIPVVSWTIQKKAGVANQTVVWYAFNKKEAQILLKNLKKFDLNKNAIKHYY